jgi:PAS domain S-box-containing protein
VLLSEMEHSGDAAIAAQRILEAVAEGHSIDQHELHVTASIGVSVFPDDGPDAETLIKSADLAMYQAKENGRRKYQFFEPAMNARAMERQSIEQNLRRALERHEFALHYQPKIDFKTGAITGAEALLRWTHPTEGSISPARFIPIAEDCGLILPIGNWVLRQACEQARAWADARLPASTMAVNISAKEFRCETFLEGVFAILDETGLDPRSLELELTESVLLKHSESAASILQALRQRGVQVALDDFGTGYSSLSYLRRFPVDALKIDQSFIGQITAAGDDASIVTAVISMARSLKLRVVAEGVETSEQLAFLRAHDCDEAQGYYFSRPVPPAEFAELLRTGISLPLDRMTSVSQASAESGDRPFLRKRAREQRPVRREPWGTTRRGARTAKPGPRMLVVDGDPSSRRSLQGDVKVGVFEVETADSPDDAILRVVAGTPDVAVLDLHLPGGATLKLLRLWKTDSPGLAVILVSGSASLSAVVAALNEGARGFFPKPFSPAVLVEQLEPSLPPTSISQFVVANHQLGTASLKPEGVDRFFAISPGLMCVAGFDGYFKVLNPAWETTLGYSVDELCSKPYLDLVHPDDREKTSDEALEIRGGQTVSRFKNRYRCKDGSYRWLEWNATPSPSQGLIYGSARDVTNGVRTEEALRESIDRLRQLVESRELLLRDSTVKSDRLVELGRVKDEAAAMIVHDLRNPLSVILSNCEYVLEGFQGPTDSREALEDSQGAGRRMLKLLTNLIDVARLEDGMLQVSVSEVNLRLLLAPLVEERMVPARARRISLVLAPAPDITATVDADLLLRTVENILDNAIRYTPADGCIEIELREAGPDVEIRLGNSGCAIPAEARRLIFDKHGQAGSGTSRMNVGQGLYFCRLASEAQGGRIWVEETERLPTLFLIRLPRRVAMAAPPRSIVPVAVPS